MLQLDIMIILQQKICLLSILLSVSSINALLSKVEAAKLTNQNEEDGIDDGLCTLTNISRHSVIAKSNVLEKALICSQIDESNYKRLVQSVPKRNKLSIQRIEITNSSSLVVLSAIGLICDRFDCSQVTVFNVSGQEIHGYGFLSSQISSWPHLEILDLSNTSLAGVDSYLTAYAKSPIVLRNLTYLILDNNNITELNFNFMLERAPNLKHLSLVNNSITSINCDEALRSKVSNQFEAINLAGNAIRCDKAHYWFIELFQDPTTSNKFPDYEQIKCSSPDRMIEMTWMQRKSVLETKICDDCECRSLKKTAISVDCNNKNLTVLPSVLPLNTKVLNLTSNRISTLSVPQNSKNWENVTYVYLENNLITSFQPFEINSKFLKNLAALDIRRNKFQEFPSHIFEQFTNLDQVHLSNNPWLCDCESTFAFQEWLQRQFHKVGDKEDIMCGISGFEENGLRSYSLQQRLSSRVIYRLSKSELCPQDNEEKPFSWLDAVNYVLGITIILILTKVTLDYIYQHRTKRLPHFFKLNL